MTHVDRRRFTVHCSTEEEQRGLLQWDGAKMDGATLRLSAAQYHMSGDEILDFVRGLLEDQEEYSPAYERLDAGKAVAPERQGRPRAIVAPMATQQETPLVVPRSPGGRPPRASSQSTTPGRGGYHSEGDVPRKGGEKGKGKAREGGRSWPTSPKGGASGFQRFVPGECNWCAQNGRPNKHYWSHCLFRREFFDRKDGRVGGSASAQQGKGAQGRPAPTFNPFNAWHNGPPKPKAAAEVAGVTPVAVGVLPTPPQDGSSSSSSLM